MEYIKKNIKVIGSAAIFLIVVVLIAVAYYLNDLKANNVYAEAQDCVCDCDSSATSPKEFYVDIKGAVKKPGVYLVNENTMIRDVIEMAGGLKSTGTTDNINLAEKVTSEMVIYICTKTELKNKTTTTTSSNATQPTTTKIPTTNQTVTNACTDYSSNTNTSDTTETPKALVNINTASKEELMSVPNIGASKADAIIIYRTETKFNKIEDIMNVSGIGEALFVKIKEYITV